MRDYPEEFDREPICEVDVDESYYIGSGEDGVYFNVKYFTDGGENAEVNGWYMSAIVDCDTSGFTQALFSDDGPYETYEDAANAGLHAAIDWCVDNEVEIDDLKIDATRDAIHLDSIFA